ncbi:alanine--tRNA ligase, partial [Patescibacteria group bacterium]|nr:alanine--tRNA ligase [Patescibacteria group bacterium]
MKSREIRRRYLEFFRKKGHAIIASASLLPKDDSTTLFVGSGMQPLVAYFLGEKHPSGTRLVNSQKSFRTEDIEEVGDNRHNTFFEMLGNWSLGDYFKKEQLNWVFDFLVKELGIDPERLFVTVFRGNSKLGIDRDHESVEIWKSIFKKAGIQAKDIDYSWKKGMRGARIFYYDQKKNWWSRSGLPENMPEGEPGGPDSEIFYDLGADLKKHENSCFRDKPCHVNCDCGRFIEIGNSVFMEFVKDARGFSRLAQKNVDFGGGLERLTMVVQKKDNVFETDLFLNIIRRIEKLAQGKKYREQMRSFEVIADHLKAACFIMGDDAGISPSNTDQGYIVRRLIRRAIRYGRNLGIIYGSAEETVRKPWTKQIAEVVIGDYGGIYPELERNRDFIIKEMTKEEEKFSKTLERGLREFGKMADSEEADNEKISGKAAFDLYQTYGFPIEMTEEMAKERELDIDKHEFLEEVERHREISRSGAQKKFKGGLADTKEKTTKLHTAAHLMLWALREILGPEVHQKGSNITEERLRFDFSWPEKLSLDQVKKVEDYVNQAIKED